MLAVEDSLIAQVVVVERVRFALFLGAILYLWQPWEIFPPEFTLLG